MIIIHLQETDKSHPLENVLKIMRMKEKKLGIPKSERYRDMNVQAEHKLKEKILSFTRFHVKTYFLIKNKFDLPNMEIEANNACSENGSFMKNCDVLKKYDNNIHFFF